MAIDKDYLQMSTTHQTLQLSSKNYNLTLTLIEDLETNHSIQIKEDDSIIEIEDIENSTHLILIEDLNPKKKRRCFLKSFKRSLVLQPKDHRNAHCAIIADNQLILSTGSCMVSIDLISFSMNWKYEDFWPVLFEFYPIEDDYLIRGELNIIRISKHGEVRWVFSGKDIWVNLEGKPEITIRNSSITLIDFNNETYEIDYNGTLIY